MRNSCFLILSCFLFFSCNNEDNSSQATGVFEAVEVIVSAEATGKLLNFEVQEGQELEKVTVVGQIDTVQLYLKKMQLKANQLSILASKPDVPSQINATEREIEKLEFEKKRTEKLLEGDVATQKQLDDIQAQLDVLNARLRAQKKSLGSSVSAIDAQYNALDVQIDQMDDQISRCQIHSPIDGTVLVKYTEPGEFVNTGKPLFKVANMSQMVLRAYVTAEQLKYIKLDQNVKVFSEFGASETKQYDGVVNWISDKSEFTPKTIQTQDERANLVYAVKIGVKNDDFLKIGMYAVFNWETE